MPDHPQPLHGETALVTGASRGIGAAILDRLAALGAFAIGTATSEAGLTAITQRLNEHRCPGSARLLKAEHPESVESLFKGLNEERLNPTILVNNAGITRDGLLARMKDEDWQAVLDTNLGSAFRLSKAVLRAMMRARHGRIINIASVVGVSGNAGQANYAAAKAGMLGFTRSLAREVAPRGITVNAVAPGFIDTDMTKALSEDQRKVILDAVPLGRLGNAWEVAEAVAFLASPGAAYITGETLHVNGGMYMG